MSWSVWGRCFEGALLVKRGDSGAGALQLRAAFETLPETNLHIQASLLLAEVAEGFGGAGQLTEGLVVIDDALARTQRTDVRWSIAELLRKKGELLSGRLRRQLRRMPRSAFERR